MCTIVALHGVRQDYPLVLATNRDEFFARPSAGPRVLLDEPRTVGGQDLRAKGTWMGVTKDGLFVGVTNQRTLRPPAPEKRSRGALVMDALTRREPAAICAMLSQLDGRDYNGFNLMFGRAGALYAAYGREDAREIAIEPVPEGVHVLPNEHLDSPAFWKVGHALEWLQGARELPWPLLRTRLEEMLADTTPAPLERLPLVPSDAPFDRDTLQLLSALCVRTPVYGTRSSTVVALTARGVGEYWFADGPPDRTRFDELSGLF